MIPTELGVGITYFKELDNILADNPNIVNVLEIEPQTIWYERKKDKVCFTIIEDYISKSLIRKYPKTLHSVGMPIGGSQFDASQLSALLETINFFKPIWVSEHLSFNQIKDKNETFKTAFFLPPLSTAKGALAATKNIKFMSKYIPIPFAIENGVNYLRRKDYEILDSEFLSKIIIYTNCGIILDLHNLWTNQQNGREPVLEFLRNIPLENVWEVHLAGGIEEDGFWLDSHSGMIPQELLEITKQIIPILPNLRTIILEIEPSYFSIIDDHTILAQLRHLHELWKLRSNKSIKKFSKSSNLTIKPESSPISPSIWESTLGSLVLGKNKSSRLANELLSDPGITIIKKRISSVRSSMLVRSLKYTIRLLLITLGLPNCKEIIHEFWKKYTPQMFASSEGFNFAKFLQTKNLKIRFLADIMKYEIALLNSSIYKNKSQFFCDYNPYEIISYLSNGNIPYNLSPSKLLIELEPNQIKITEV